MSTGKKSALYSALILSASSIGLQLLGFGYRIFISRVTGAEGMGVYQLVMPVYSILYSITLSGLCTAVTSIASSQNALGDGAGMLRLVRQSLLLFMMLFGAVALPAALFSGWISERALGDAETRLALLIMLPCLFLTGFENIFKSWFYGIKNVKPPALSDQLEQIVRIAAVASLLLAFPPESPAMAAALIVAGATSTYPQQRKRREAKNQHTTCIGQPGTVMGSPLLCSTTAPTISKWASSSVPMSFKVALTQQIKCILVKEMDMHSELALRLGEPLIKCAVARVQPVIQTSIFHVWKPGRTGASQS